MQIAGFIEQGTIPAVDNGDGTFTATVLVPMIASGIAIYPAKLDVAGVVRRPVITVGRHKVAAILSLWRSDDGDVVIRFRFDSGDMGMRAERLFRTGLLWNVQAFVTVSESDAATSDDKMRIHDSCEYVATSASLDSIGLDPYAPY